MAEEFQRRFPSVSRMIGDIRREDIRVAIIGTVVDRQGNRIIVDDGTGKINVSLIEGAEVNPNQFVRVLGRVIPKESGFEMQGEIVQDMSGLDMDLLKAVRSMEGESV